MWARASEVERRLQIITVTTADRAQGRESRRRWQREESRSGATMTTGTGHRQGTGNVTGIVVTGPGIKPGAEERIVSWATETGYYVRFRTYGGGGPG